MRPLAIETEGLGYRYGSATAVAGVGLRVARGEIFGFVGPNGAGKTTTIKLILGLLTPSEGSVRVLGRDLREGRAESCRRVGSLVETPALYPHLTVEENLTLDRVARGLGAASVSRALGAAGLEGARRKPVRECSLGMKQRLGLALALLHGPELLVLDEPNNGLDPEGVLEFRLALARLAAEEGVTVFVSSHVLAELETVATWIGVIANGAIRFQGRLADLKGARPGRLRIAVDDADRAEGVLSSAGFTFTRRPEGPFFVEVPDRERTQRLVAALVEAGIGVFEVRTEEPTLEGAFLELVDRRAGDVA
jgi:ABC-type multidrug transport system ATPase subunit